MEFLLEIESNCQIVITIKKNRIKIKRIWFRNKLYAEVGHCVEK